MGLGNGSSPVTIPRLAQRRSWPDPPRSSKSLDAKLIHQDPRAKIKILRNHNSSRRPCGGLSSDSDASFLRLFHDSPVEKMDGAFGEIGVALVVSHHADRRAVAVRSEEHTSELQSPCNIV